MKIITGNTSKKIFDMDIGKGKPATTIISTIIPTTKNPNNDRPKLPLKKEYKLR